MEVKYIDFQSHGDARGNLGVAEYGKELPFPIQRVYFIYGVEGNQRRGFHAHKELHQVLFAIHGSCKVLLDDGTDKETVLLDSPVKGILIDTPTWREIFDFSKDAVLVCFASDVYRVSDYIRDYDAFLQYVKDKK